MKQKKWLEVGSNPSRFFGASYTARMWALRNDPRPMITLHLVWVVLWIKLPWRHVMPKRFAAAVASWGFVVRLYPFPYGHGSWRYENKRFL